MKYWECYPILLQNKCITSQKSKSGLESLQITRPCSCCCNFCCNFCCNLIILHCKPFVISVNQPVKTGFVQNPCPEDFKTFQLPDKTCTKMCQFCALLKCFISTLIFFFLLVSMLLCFSFVKLAFSNVKSLLPTE